MKDLQEYKTEIFRRSAQRLAAKKARRHHLMTCGILFCACILFCSVWLHVSRLTGDADTAPEAGAENTSQPNDVGLRADYIAVQIGNRQETDPDEIERLLTVLLSALQDGTPYHDDGNKENTGYGSSSITFITPSGAQRSYLLTQSRLTDIAAAKTVVLTEDQLLTLQQEIDRLTH